MKRLYAGTAAGLLLYVVLVWFLPGWLGLSGGDVWVLRVALVLIGVAAAALVVYFVGRGQVEASAQTGGLAGDLRFLVQEANTRLAASRGVRQGGKNVADLPLVLFLGDAGATKTSVIVNSGLDPELLAGQIYQGEAIAPTRAANLWLAAGRIFVESGGAVSADAAALATLVRLLRARKLANRLGRSGQSPRSVVLCVDAASLAVSGREWAATARRYQAILGEIAQVWGSQLPVYVLFTRLDQLQYFQDFFRNLSRDEASQAFGVTLPFSSAEPAGAYNDRQTAGLTQAFDSLFYRLADRRPDHLRRENDPARFPNVYEFPREFRKIRDNAVRLLLDVGRPSQLRASPFLRGFYFTGVRPIAMEEGAPPVLPAPAENYEGGAGATRIFSGGPSGLAAQAAALRRPPARRVPQWVFLSRFFKGVLLEDRTAQGASGVDTRASMVRRAMFAAAASLLVIWMIGGTVSFIRNRGLISRAAAALKGLSAARSTPGQMPSAEALRQLEQLRQVAAEAGYNQRSGAPMSFRWGLYPGQDLYDTSRALYCREFGTLLLSDARNSLAAYLKGLPRTPEATADYAAPFDCLKAYLMTTSHPAQADAGFLSGVLAEHWSSGRALTDEQKALARKQFEFYAAERASNLCPAREDEAAVANARSYLWQFKPLDRIYRNILDEVAKRGRPYVFSDPAGAVADKRAVPFYYTRAGWPGMQAAIREFTKYYSREPWVLGEEPTPSGKLELQQQLRERYTAGYASEWRQFLANSTVPPFTTFADASRKLESITSSQSSLLRLFCAISVNTNIDAPEIQKEFQPIHGLQPPATCETRLNDAATQPYMGAMATLKFQVDEIVRRSDPSAVSLDSINAKVAASKTAQSLNLPKPAEDLLLAPILSAERLEDRKVPEAANAKGAEFCRSAAAVFRKFPFNPRASEDAGLDEFNTVFQPGRGLFAKFYQESLQDLVAAKGLVFARKPGAKVNVTPAFLAFLNQAGAISNAFYAANGDRPSLTFTVQAEPSTDVDSFVLQIGGKALKGSGRGGERQEFTWTGDGAPVSLTARAKIAPETIQEAGTWALFRLLFRANRVTGGGTIFEYDLVSTSSFGRQAAGSSARQATLRLQVEARGASGLFGNLRMSCVSRVAQ